MGFWKQRIRCKGIGENALTDSAVRFTLERLKCGRESFPCHCYFPQFFPGWEVVQLVGLQTLDLAILVRVQASQPILL
jgi:hypothetical protein